jgi:hypothetical protein
MNLRRIAMTALVAVFMTTALSAQEATPRINKRQRNQQQRIEQGAKSGQLTKKEVRHLEARESKIQADKINAKADGKVTAAERRKLKREENRASKAIYRQKHDAQTK